jgi:arginyl-tRNA synthetase
VEKTTNIKQAIESKLSIILPGAVLSVSDHADFACNACFAAAKQTGKSPVELAAAAAAEFNAKYAELAAAAAENGFINFTLTSKVLKQAAEFAVINNALPLPAVKQKTVFFDYGGANVAKELHVGHLRSPIIGEALKRVHEAFGHKTIADAYLGDWGLQMGLVIAEILDRKLNVEKVTTEMLSEIYPAASKRKNTDKEFYNRAAAITLSLQNLEEPYYSMWKVLRELSVTQIEKNYKTLNCTFNFYNGESTYQPYVADVLKALTAKKLLHESQGAMIVDVARTEDNKPMPPIILSKSNGGDLYATSDVAALYARAKTYKPDRFIYITDARQTLHLEQVFRTVKMAGFVTAEIELVHIPYGTINGTDGKPFRTRDGGTIKLEDIFTAVANAAALKSPDKKTAVKIGLAAIKFADLINNVRRDYIFDINKCVSFEGKTGPYVLYTIVRINSLLAKSGFNNRPEFSNIDKYLTPTVRSIFVDIIKLTESYTAAINTLSLNTIADAVYNLANDFSVLYAEQNILNMPDKDKQTFLLSVAILTKTALTIGLNTLAIDTVERM